MSQHNVHKSTPKQRSIITFVKGLKESNFPKQPPKEQRERERVKQIQTDTNQERTKRSTSVQRIHEREKHFTPLKDRLQQHLSKTSPRQSVKNRTPPSLEKINIAKKLHFEETNMNEQVNGHDDIESETPKEVMEKPTEEEQKDPKKTMTELERHEVRILEKIEKLLQPINTTLRELSTELREHKEEMKQIRDENCRLEYNLNKERKKNKSLGRQVRWLEDKLLENNIVMHGIAETPWESKDFCKEKIFNVLANLFNRSTWQEKLDIARQIPITTVRRVGPYNSMRCRPVIITFSCKSNAEYLLENKRRLGRGIFADQEYGPETERNRKLLRPIFNAARKHEDYKGKCKLEGDQLILQGKEYTVDMIGTLPPKINGFRATSKADGRTLAFFGELNPLSNFHPSEFEHNGIIFHSSEQLIQYMKSIYFDDKASASAILNCDSPLECKRLARNIINYNHEEWMKAAKSMCDVGIYEKFNQNPSLRKLLLSTGNQTITEACKDRDWGSGMSLYDERCLVRSTWYSQGLLGIILEEVRELLKLADIEGRNETNQATMDTEEYNSVEEQPAASD